MATVCIVCPCCALQLQLKGVDVLGEDGGSVAVDTELLMEVLEKRELLAETPSRTQIMSMRAELVSDISDMLRRLSRVFAAGDLDAARKLTIKLQYFTKLMSEVEAWEAANPPLSTRKM